MRAARLLSMMSAVSICAFGPLACSAGSSSGPTTADEGLTAQGNHGSGRDAGPDALPLTISDGPVFDYGRSLNYQGKSHVFTISNDSTEHVTDMAAASVAAPFGYAGGQYPGAGGTCGTHLGPGASCTVVLTFAPSSNDHFKGQAAISYRYDRSTAVATIGLKAKSGFRIMPLGDSITWGFEDHPPSTVFQNSGGYRATLWNALSPHFPISFVGTNPNFVAPGDPPGMDTGNEGHPGWTSQDLLLGHPPDAQNPNGGGIETWLPADRPDVVLLMIGTNDIYHGFSLDQSASYMAQLYDRILDYPDVSQLVVASIINCASGSPSCDPTGINNLAKSLVQARAAAGRHIAFVDMNAEAALQPSDYGLEVHPNPSGYAKIGHVWANHVPQFLASRGDVTGDGVPDIFFRNTAGANFIWPMKADGTHTDGDVSFFDSLDPAWQPGGYADFNQDGQTDIAWRNYTTGEDVIWLMNGLTHVSTASINFSLPDPAWHMVGAGDANGDGKPDLHWENYSTFANYYWIMDGTNFVAGVQVDNANGNYHTQAVADFNHDGIADRVWRNIQTGNDIIWVLNAQGHVQDTLFLDGEPDQTWSVGGAADFNNDTYPDLVWHNVDGRTRLWLMNGAVATSKIAYDDVLTADWRVVGPK